MLLKCIGPTEKKKQKYQQNKQTVSVHNGFFITFHSKASEDQ